MNAAHWIVGATPSNIILARLLHCPKAPPSMLVTLLGIVTLLRLLHSQKALDPMLVTLLGIIWGGAFRDCTSLTSVTFLGNAPKIGDNAFEKSSPTIYREADAKGWSDTLAGRPVKLITEKP